MAATDQQLATITYQRPRLTITADVNLKTEFRLVEAEAPNKVTIEQYVDLDSSAVAQTDTVAITAGSGGDLYNLSVVIDAVENTYSYKQSATDTATTIATKLARRLDVDPNVTATATGNIITLKAVKSGTIIAYDKTGSTTAGNLTIANVTVASGAGKKVKLSKATLVFNVDSKGLPGIDLEGEFYDGNLTSPLRINSFGPLPVKGSKSLDQMQTEAGVPRTN